MAKKYTASGKGPNPQNIKKPTTKTKDEPLRGPDLLCAAVNQILAHPETWLQTSWHCDTQHCIAGHCEMLTGGETSNTMENVRGKLGISQADASYLFAAERTLPEIYSFAKVYRAGFNRAGFDRDGFDRAGFDRDGFDRDGFDRAGFNRDGFNRDGFNRDGFDRAGFNRDGFDRAGFNRDGQKLEMIPFDL